MNPPLSHQHTPQDHLLKKSYGRFLVKSIPPITKERNDMHKRVRFRKRILPQEAPSTPDTKPRLTPGVPANKEPIKIAAAAAATTAAHDSQNSERGREGVGGKKTKRVKTLPNSTVTLMPRPLSCLDSSTSNRSPGRRLLTPGLLPLKCSALPYASCEHTEQGETTSQAGTCRGRDVGRKGVEG